jgi:hypothetical protein
MARDDDARPQPEQPAERYSPKLWDALDMTLFRPMTRFLLADVGGEATNVNALDEVPDSTWFTNRLGAKPMTKGEVVRGACDGAGLDPGRPWKVVAAKPNGANPGFTVEADGARYIVKLDGLLQPYRASSGDTIGSRIYHAAGFNVPCNQVVHFRRDLLRLAPEAKGEDRAGEEVPLSEAMLDEIVTKTTRLPDGRHRANASRLLDGEPLGPFRYHGTREDDRNDVVPHEDRRELRGSYLLAAWLNHFDAREMNSLDTWIAVEGGGYVRHHLIDWGDCFGSLWPWEDLARRIGHSYYFDLGHILVDFFTLGAIERPWDRARFGRAGMVWAYFGADNFEPDDYHPGYPNPAFQRMTERDGAWMARIMAGFTDEVVDALVALAQIPEPIARDELARVLKARRDTILARYLGKLSALARPVVRRGELCLDDVALAAVMARRKDRRYAARLRVVDDGADPVELAVREEGEVAVCVALPAPRGPRRYVVVDVLSWAPRARKLVPARVHLYDLGAAGWKVVGLERPG